MRSSLRDGSNRPRQSRRSRQPREHPLLLLRSPCAQNYRAFDFELQEARLIRPREPAFVCQSCLYRTRRKRLRRPARPASFRGRFLVLSLAVSVALEIVDPASVSNAAEASPLSAPSRTSVANAGRGVAERGAPRLQRARPRASLAPHGGTWDARWIRALPRDSAWHAPAILPEARAENTSGTERRISPCRASFVARHRVVAFSSASACARPHVGPRGPPCASDAVKVSHGTLVGHGGLRGNSSCAMSLSQAKADRGACDALALVDACTCFGALFVSALRCGKGASQEIDEREVLPDTAGIR